jgi:hypothetical protein
LAEQAAEQAIEMAQKQIKSAPGLRVALISKGRLASYAATSSTAGKLEKGPEKIDFRALRPQNDSDRALAASLYAPQRRIQEGRSHGVIAAGAAETLSLDLAGAGGGGEIIVVGPKGVARAAFPEGEWKSRVELRPDGTIRAISGARVEARFRSAEPAAVPGPAAGAQQAQVASPRIGGGCS